jgi:VWFA-related protein
MVLALIPFAMVLDAQQAAAPAAEKPTTTFTARTELVTVPVVVTGKGGKHLTGLKQADFVVEENGHRREIATFEEITTSANPYKQPANAADQFTNFLSPDPQTRRITIVVLDLLNTPFIRQAETRRQMVHFLATHLEDTGPTSLSVLTSKGLRQVHSFTSDTSVLIEALKKVESTLSTPDVLTASAMVDPESANPLDDPVGNDPTSQANALQEIFAERADAMYGNFKQKQQTLITLEALEEIAEASAGMAGRKSLVWATGGLPFLLNDPDNVTGIDTSLMENYDRTWHALNNANISVYPIDANGLQAPSLTRRDMTARGHPPGVPTSSRGGMRPPTPLPVDAQRNALDSMRAFANATGGKACYNTNDLGDCLARAGDDSSQYYLLSYYLPTDDRKPGWRKLKVRVVAQHDDVRARDGFFVGAQNALDSKSMLQQFQLAASSALDYTAIPLGMKIKSVTAADAGQHKVDFVVIVEGNSNVIDTTNNNHVSVELNAVAENAKGERIHVFGRNVNANLKPESLAMITKTGFGFTGDLMLPAGKFHLLRFVVRDDLSGRIGTITVPLQVE